MHLEVKQTLIFRQGGTCTNLKLSSNILVISGILSSAIFGIPRMSFTSRSESSSSLEIVVICNQRFWPEYLFSSVFHMMAIYLLIQLRVLVTNSVDYPWSVFQD